MEPLVLHVVQLRYVSFDMAALQKAVAGYLGDDGSYRNLIVFVSSAVEQHEITQNGIEKYVSMMDSGNAAMKHMLHGLGYQVENKIKNGIYLVDIYS